MKRFRFTTVIALASLMLFTAGLAGCRNKAEADRDAYERIQNALLTMTGYAAEATVTYISNKSQHTYQVRQQARMSGEYRIEVTGPERVAGNITVSDNKTITQFNTRVQGRFSVLPDEAPERLELFVTSFVKNYLRSQEVTISVASVGESLCTVLEATIPGEHPYLRTEKLWVSNTTHKPVKLSIYDPDGVERVTVTFESFEFNVDFDDSVFRMQ
ncbi:MAG: hypothetical protein FWE91_02145 [Defluviitaleaceae bacterium]|nr:hypothetical protein [Defluviitaleaceae bacterium]MCL2835108.1 hypothetical protein [Defluviitaleaceae bacterium]